MHYLFSSVLSRCCHRGGLFQLVLLVFLVFFSVAGSPTLCLKCCWQTTWSFSSFYALWGRVFPTRADVFHKKGKWQVAFHFTLHSCRNYAAQTRLWNWNGNGGIEKRLKCMWGKNKLLAIPDRLAVRRFPLSPQTQWSTKQAVRTWTSVENWPTPYPVFLMSFFHCRPSNKRTELCVVCQRDDDGLKWWKVSFCPAFFFLLIHFHENYFECPPGLTAVLLGPSAFYFTSSFSPSLEASRRCL